MKELLRLYDKVNGYSSRQRLGKHRTLLYRAWQEAAFAKRQRGRAQASISGVLFKMSQRLRLMTLRYNQINKGGSLELTKSLSFCLRSITIYLHLG